MAAQIVKALTVCTLPSDPNERKEAESFLTSNQKVPGYGRILFDIVNEASFDFSVRHLASILFKNLTFNQWSPLDRVDHFFTLEDKQHIKDNLLNSIAQSHVLVRAQLEVALGNIIDSDYPTEYPQLAEQIMQMLSSQESHYLISGLLALRKIFKLHEWVDISDGDNRDPELQDLCNSVFPVLTHLFEFLLPFNNVQSSQSLTLICKIFGSATLFDIPEYFNLERFRQWMNFFFAVLQSPLPPDAPEDHRELDRWAPWILRKHVGICFHKLYINYSMGECQNGNFAEYFRSELAFAILEQCFNFLYTYKVTPQQYYPKKILKVFVEITTQGVSVSNIWKNIKPLVLQYIEEILIGILLLDEEDLIEFEEDPYQFIRSETDLKSILFSHRLSIISFVELLIDHRGNTCAEPIVNLIVGIFQKYRNQPEKFFLEMDACLVLLGHSSRHLVRESQAMEQILTEYVIPAIYQGNPLIQSRAIWTFSRFCRMPFQNMQVYNSAVEGVIAALMGDNAGMKIFSSLSLRNMLKSPAEEVLEKHLEGILGAYLTLIHHVDIDDIVLSFNTFLEVFSDSLPQYAVKLVASLIETFNSIIMKEIAMANTQDELHFDTEDIINDNTPKIALVILQSISILVGCVNELPEACVEMEKLLVPVLLSLNEYMSDYFMAFIDILLNLTFNNTDTVSPGIWSVVEHFYKGFMMYAKDHLLELTPILDNCIYYGTEEFMSGPHLGYAYNIFEYGMTSEYVSQTEWGEACKLIEVVMLCCRGALDHAIPSIINLALGRLNDVSYSGVKLLLMETIINAIYYNPQIAFSHLNQLNMINNFWNELESVVPDFKRSHDAKLTALALTSILTVPSNQLPKPLLDMLNRVFSLLLGVLVRHEELIDPVDDFEPPMDFDFSVFENVLSKQYGDDEDINIDLSEMMSKIKQYTDIDSNDAYTLEKDAEFTTAISEVDPSLIFVQTIKELSNREPQTYRSLTSSLNQNDAQIFQAIINSY
eukprot:TRINITY_DN3970_c0_g1_i1.p1 TRINITY_DN3970_c0_g1~~TRINITY_DN3970_c0_g1_i1.p1  ORF type:complete len:994 (-),score=208.64 TRINITY_DN3970_c0_g1_i1:21-3002(-)